MLNVQKRKKYYQIHLPHIDIAVAEWGDTNGKPIIAIHGWLDNMASFYPLLSETSWLEQHNLRLITIDLPGHGHSGHRHSSHPCNLLEYVQDLYDLIEYFDFDKVSIIGHSLGAAIATLFAGAFPSKVSSLVVIEGITPLSENAESGPSQLAKSLEQRYRYKSRDERFHEDLRLLVKARSTVGDLDEENVILLVERNTEKTDKGYRWRSDPRLRLPSPLYFTPEQSTAFINKLEAPVLLLYGKDGFIHKYPALKEVVTRLNHVISTTELEGGHHLHMQHPDAVREAIMDFYKRC